jgi:Ice-binding-like
VTSVRCNDPSPAARPRRRSAARHGAAGTAVLLALSAGLLASASNAQAVATAVPMGTAEPFAVLAGLGITSTGPTTVNGDIGTYPNTAMSVSGPLILNGTDHSGDGVTQTAKSDLTAAYLAAAGQTPDTTVSADLAGQTLTPGVYFKSDGLEINGPVPLTLDAEGDPNAVFVFRSGSHLTTQPNTRVELVDGATACNVFWQVTSSTTLGVNSTFRGTILTLTDSTLNTGATLEGSVFSRNGAVVLDQNTIVRPDCASDVTATYTAAGAGGTGGAGGSGGTGGQITRVPVGPVDAGGGPAAVATRFRSATAR